MPKPSRSDLLAAIASLQDIVGAAHAAMNDRNENREAEVKGYLDQALKFCVEARSYDPPGAGSRSSGQWIRRPVRPNP